MIEGDLNNLRATVICETPYITRWKVTLPQYIALINNIEKLCVHIITTYRTDHVFVFMEIFGLCKARTEISFSTLITFWIITFILEINKFLKGFNGMFYEHYHHISIIFLSI